jgi:hypothetical protein
MQQSNVPQDTRILTIKVTLDGSDPPVWRRFQISGSATLDDLHYVLQLVMGWTNSHLHEFRIGRRRFAAIDDDDYGEEPLEDEAEFELCSVLKRKGSRFEYIYDFGDCWVHQGVVEERAEPRHGAGYPVCLDGERSCPPEDCGGIHGYYNMLEILKDPEDEEYETYREWLHEDFDPDKFDVNQANENLEEIEEMRWLAEDEDAF